MRAIRFRAFILTPLLVAPTGRYAAGVARVRYFRAAACHSANCVTACLPADALAEAGQ